MKEHWDLLKSQSIIPVAGPPFSCKIHLTAENDRCYSYVSFVYGFICYGNSPEHGKPPQCVSFNTSMCFFQKTLPC